MTERLRTARHSTGAYRIERREMSIPGPWESWHKLVEGEKGFACSEYRGNMMNYWKATRHFRYHTKEFRF